MKRSRAFPTGLLMTALTLMVLSTGDARAASDRDSTELFRRQHQAGVRIGVWSNQGELPAASGLFNDSGEFETNIHGSSAYIEGFFGYRLFPWLTAELTLGTVNRGSVTLFQLGASDVGNLVIYPIMLQLKFYTPRLPGTSLYPFGLIGGGVQYGRRSVQFTTSQYYYANWEEESATDFNYVVGGGIDWPVAEQIGLEFSVKYMPMNLSLVGIEKQDALAFMVGVKYLYLRK